MDVENGAERVPVCKSVFRDGGEKPDGKWLTERWIEMVNLLEQGGAASRPEDGPDRLPGEAER